ncbi:MAG: indole-3-glycerol phosphate synthase TrpC [Proteobacteria bacterium]|nr:indole-3-glycerol phosphate synthase TrpC [Pseudomonadota bacterium]
MLKQILAHARERAANADERVADLRRLSEARGPVRSLSEALMRPGLSIVAEIKRRSPSVGVIDISLDPVARAGAYVAGGADAISVLTEPMFFDGSMADLATVRDSVDVPVLRKDFTMAPSQIWEARAGGADAVLLIVAALDETTLEDLVATARTVGVEAIVEAHSAGEVRRAIDAGATIVGVNNRDLTTFATDLGVAESIGPLLDDVEVTVAESGVSTKEGALRMGKSGYDAILVGEALVRSPDPEQLVRELKDPA